MKKNLRMEEVGDELKIPLEHDVRTDLTEILEDFVRHGLIDPDPLGL